MSQSEAERGTWHEFSLPDRQNQRLREIGWMTRQGQAREALPLLDEFLAANPDHRKAWDERGHARLFTGDYVGAIADFDEMIRRWPTNPAGYCHRARVRGAIADYTTALAVDPNHPYAVFQRGRIKAQAGDLVGAIADFTVDMARNKMGPVSGLLNRGRALHRLGDLAGALADFTEAMRHSCGPPIYAALGRARVKLTAGDYTGAIADFTLVIESYDRLPNAYRERAETRALLGDQVGADAGLAKYQELGGKDLPAYAQD
jgi:tetratricopeptide (TPR) repeat protein